MVSLLNVLDDVENILDFEVPDTLQVEIHQNRKRKPAT